MKELKPCPFCGCEAMQVGFSYENGLTWWVQCSECGAKAKGVEAWNTRAERACRNVNKEWEKTSFAHAGTSFCCSECGAHYEDYESYYAALADRDGEHIRTNYCPNCGAKVVE